MDDVGVGWRVHDDLWVDVRREERPDTRSASPQDVAPRAADPTIERPLIPVSAAGGDGLEELRDRAGLAEAPHAGG